LYLPGVQLAAFFAIRLQLRGIILRQGKWLPLGEPRVSGSPDESDLGIAETIEEPMAQFNREGKYDQE